MERLSEIKKKHGLRVMFFIGNREVTRSNKFAFPRDYVDETIWNPCLFKNGNGDKVLLAHGDLINYLDTGYLRWKKVFRSGPFQFMIRILPNRWLSKFMFALEKKILEATINNQVRKSKRLPADIFEEYATWIDEVLGKGDKLLALAGHIHPPAVMEKKIGKSRVLILKAWADGKNYYELDFDTLTFEEREFSE